MPKTPANQDIYHVFHFACPSFYFPTTIPYCNEAFLASIYSNGIYLYLKMKCILYFQRVAQCFIQLDTGVLANHKLSGVEFLFNGLYQYYVFVYLYVDHCL